MAWTGVSALRAALPPRSQLLAALSSEMSSS